jgi:hypothetical protein
MGKSRGKSGAEKLPGKAKTHIRNANQGGRGMPQPTFNCQKSCYEESLVWGVSRQLQTTG